MARFSSFIYTDRGTEVHRLGHSSIQSVTYSGEISIHTELRKLGSGTKSNPYHERGFIYLDQGYGDYSEKYLRLCSLDEYGRVTLPADLLEKVREHNDRITKNWPDLEPLENN